MPPDEAPRRVRRKLTRPNLSLQMLVARESVTGFFRPTFRKFDITEQQWRILRVIDEGGPMTIGRVSEQSFIVGPSISGILSRMIDAGLVAKDVDRADGRKAMISLTPFGAELVQDLIVEIKRAYRKLGEALGSEDVELLYTLTERIIGKIDRYRAISQED